MIDFFKLGLKACWSHVMDIVTFQRSRRWCQRGCFLEDGPGRPDVWNHSLLENYLCCMMALEMLYYGLELPFVMLDDGCSSLTVQRSREIGGGLHSHRIFHNLSRFFKQSLSFPRKIFTSPSELKSPWPEHVFNIWKCNSLKAWPAPHPIPKLSEVSSKERYAI